MFQNYSVPAPLGTYLVRRRRIEAAALDLEVPMDLCVMGAKDQAAISLWEPAVDFAVLKLPKSLITLTVYSDCQSSNDCMKFLSAISAVIDSAS